MSESKRATLSIRPGALTKEQEAAAIHAGSIAAGANALLAGGMISREQHARILRALAPSVQPVFDALAALSPLSRKPPAMNTSERDPRLTYDDRGDIELNVVWSLKPGQPQIIAICSSVEIAERYKPHVEQNHGGMFYVERVWLDHAFGRRDMQTTIYKAAMKGQP